MEQYRDNQYDDDLTIGTDEYDDSSFETSDIDLFEFGGEEDSPIARLKTLVLSIDWEITDEVLTQFNEELIDLKDIWADEKILQVYLQALEKIGRYIQKEKADSHPNAIKLLLSMYYNLEKIVLSGDYSEADQKKMLVEDVRRFEGLKKLIAKKPESAAVPKPGVIATAVPHAEVEVPELRKLKNVVYGIDWEISNEDLVALKEEIAELSEEYSDRKPRLVFLQGIGTLGTYIFKKKSNSHADAFKILHSFYAGLETLVQNPEMSLAEEKEILLPEVKKFNAFKELIAETLASTEEEVDEDEIDESREDGVIAPAFSDMPEEGTHGFQEDVEAASLAERVMDVDQHLDNFFGEEEAPTVGVTGVSAGEESEEESIEKEIEAFSDAFFSGGDKIKGADQTIDRDLALQGVDVETEADDESDEEELPTVAGDVAPALAADEEEVSAFSEEEIAKATEDELPEEVGGRLDSFFGSDESAESDLESSRFDVPADVALQGVDVEAEEEEELPEEISGKLDSFFGSDESAESAAESSRFDVSADVALQGVDVEAEGEEDEEELIGEDFGIGGDIAPAFADIENGFEIPSDVLSDDELPMEPTEFNVTGEPADTAEQEVVAEDSFEAEADVEDRFDQLFGTGDEIDEGRVAEQESDVAPAFADLEEEEIVAFEPVEEPFDETIIEPVSEEDIEKVSFPAESVEATPLFEGLQGAVQSLNIELNDSIISGTYAEIDSLSEEYEDNPVAKSYLQLMTTIVNHIDQYRFNASDQSNTLLGKVVADLELSQSLEPKEAQDKLLDNITRVLQWQQEMLNSRAVKAEDGSLMFSETATAEAVVEEDAGIVIEEDTDDSIKIVEAVKRELNALKESLTKEIAEIKSKLKKD